MLLLLLPLLLAPTSLSHGDHSQQQPLTDSATDPTDWATQHLASEHHISNFDPRSFFALHDYDSDGRWEPHEIRRTYGMADGNTDGLGGPGATGNPDETRKKEVERAVLELFDANADGFLSVWEWEEGLKAGKRLPDFGHGPGHHGDDEYEYEIHHYERFHDENTKESELTHPEDIAHFRKHDEMDAQADRQAVEDRQSIVEHNIPSKFRRW